LNWVKRAGYVCENGFRPTYTMSKDWNKIKTALNEYADLKNPRNYFFKETSDKFHARVCVIDGRVQRYNNNDIAVYVPIMEQPRMASPRFINILLQY
jgi:hypothetical protein